MSLINDALKRAQQNQQAPSTQQQPAAPQSLRMVPATPPPANPRKRAVSPLIPIMVILFIVAALAAGWTAMHRKARTVAAASPQAAVPVHADPVQVTAASPAAVPIAAHTAAPVAEEPATPTGISESYSAEPDPVPTSNPSDMPKLQGILFVTGKSSAIIDGKSVRAGEKFLQYRVKEISQFTVTLVDASGKAIKLGLSN